MPRPCSTATGQRGGQHRLTATCDSTTSDGWRKTEDGKDGLLPSMGYTFTRVKQGYRSYCCRVVPAMMRLWMKKCAGIPYSRWLGFEALAREDNQAACGMRSWALRIL